MKLRVLLVVLLTLVVGAVAGYAVAGSRSAGDDGERTPEAVEIAPVPASPELPVVVTNPDPSDPTLETGIALKTTKLVLPPTGEPTYVVDLPTPVGWTQTFFGGSSWNFTVPTNSKNTYVMRVMIIADQGATIAAAVRSRTAALGSAEKQKNLQDLEITPDADGSGFESTYIDGGDFRRVSIERFFGGPDPSQAFVSVAVSGRVQDRDGLADLLDRVTKDIRTTQNPS